jgi:predicted NUDIX family NTP pyrophosphohydrolase
MARFDPKTYPDRLAFEANARRIRTEELGKAIDGAVAWLGDRRQELTGRLRKFATAPSTPAHRHSTR